MTSRAEFEQRRHELADHILTHPEKFDMSTFGTKGPACGTVACLAGTAGLLAAQRGEVQLVWTPADECANADLNAVTLPDGSSLPIDSWAFLHLGLTSTGIFYEDTIDEPELAAKAILEAPYRNEP